MRKSAEQTATGQDNETADLTRQIRALSTTQVSIEKAARVPERRHTALLICHDTRSRKWGPKWLWQAGFETKTVTESSQAADAAQQDGISIVIVDAGLRDESREPLLEALKDVLDESVPVIALCSNPNEMAAALDGGVYDVVRKPVDWRLVSRRARTAVHARHVRTKLDVAEQSLQDALNLADSARKNLRTRESFDPVTGLPTKGKFAELVQRAMPSANGDGNALALFVVGFSRFRLVVEAMGQATAERVMSEISRRLTTFLSELGPRQTGANGLRAAAGGALDGERFGIMFTCSGETDELLAHQQLLTDQLSQPVQIDGQIVHLSACIGAAVYPGDASSVDQLLARADKAMRDVQGRGSGFRFYSAEADAAAARKLRIEHLLHEAFARDELEVAYQPLTHVRSGVIVGAEALLRWTLDDGTPVSPGEFVPIAEDCGLMNRIGEFVLDRACRQLKLWHAGGHETFRMSVNVSKCQLMSGDFVAQVKRLIDEHDIDPACLDLELSERGVLSGDYSVIGQLEQLKQIGVQLSIDDFGTGESAMGYLKELPVDVMKIDRSYINGVTKSRKDTAITSAMVALAQQLDLLVIAEGVETSEQLAFLRELGCDVYQGFHLSPAVSSEAFAEMLERNSREASSGSI